MIQVLNPGNILPFNRNSNLQRHRLQGTDTLPYGLPAPNTRLIPWQFWMDEDFAEMGALSWQLFNVVDNTSVYVQDVSLLEVKCKTTTVSDPIPRFWITFKGDQLSSVPPCSFYEIRVYLGDILITSEVLHLREYADFELAALLIEDCEVVEATTNFSLISSDALIGTVVTQTIDVEIEPDFWSSLGTDSGLLDVDDDFLVLAPYPINLRRIVTTSLGNTLTTYYTLSWTDDEDPCGTYTLTLVSQTLAPASFSRDLWRLTFTNSKDKGDVLYQTGYTQELFLEPGPVFNAPGIDRAVEITVDGFGSEVKRFTRTREQWRWETLDIPDYLIHTLTILGDVDEIVLENLGKQYTVPVENFVFTTRRQSPSQNVGQFQVDRRLEVFSGCAEDYAVTDCA